MAYCGVILGKNKNLEATPAAYSIHAGGFSWECGITILHSLPRSTARSSREARQ